MTPERKPNAANLTRPTAPRPPSLFESAGEPAHSKRSAILVATGPTRQRLECGSLLPLSSVAARPQPPTPNPKEVRREG